MRVTIDLPDALAAEAQARAATEGRTLTSLAEEGLRMVLDEGRGARGRPVQPMPVFGDPDGGFLLDLSDREALWQALDADGPR